MWSPRSSLFSKSSRVLRGALRSLSTLKVVLRICLIERGMIRQEVILIASARKKIFCVFPPMFNGLRLTTWSFWNVRFTPSSFLQFIIYHWTARGKMRDILLLPLSPYKGLMSISKTAQHQLSLRFAFNFIYISRLLPLNSSLQISENSVSAFIY